MPEDSIHRNYYVKQVNDEHLRHMVSLTRRTFTEALNNEIYFSRTWGLPTHYKHRLDAEAERRGVLPKDLVAVYIHGEVSKWPQAKTPKSDPARVMAKRSTLTLTGPNDAHILRLCEQLGLEHSAVMDGILDFNRRFDLPPQLLGALHERAEALGVMERDLAIEILFFEVAKLPDAPVVAKKKKS